MYRSLMLLVTLAALASAASAQLPFRYSTFSPSNGLSYGRAAAGIGDVDGDGMADFAITEAAVGPFLPPGLVHVYSGAGGDLLYTLVGKSAADGYGLAIAGVGDVNGDGVPDIVIGAADDDSLATASGRVEVVSGNDGSLIHELFGATFLGGLGKTVCGMGDLNGDGLADFAVTEFGLTFVHLFSGVDASIINTIDMPPEAGFTQTPDSIALAGDFDGDGKGDLLAGDRGFEFGGGPSNVGAIWVISSATGLPVQFVSGNESQEQIGFAVAGGVDLDGDGVPEFIGGAPPKQVAGQPVGSVACYSGLTGLVLAEHFGDGVGLDLLGVHVAFVGDVNGDGAQDYAGVSTTLGTIGATGYLEVYSGADHSVLDRMDNPLGGSDFFGAGFAVVGDSNGDGLPEIVVGAPGFGSQAAHVMTVAGDRIYGELAEPAQTLVIDWVPSGGPDPAIGVVQASGAPANATGLLLLSFAPDALLFQGSTTVLVDLLQPSALVLATAFDVTGQTAAGPASLRQPVLDGLSVYAQFVALDAGAPAGWATSPGLELRLTD